MFSRVLIANRGEIAIRIARAAKALGIDSLGVYAELDKDSLHTRYPNNSVQLPRDASSDAVGSYLNQENLIRIATENDCDCLHPGYGFLSENADFAERCAESGITFVGPTPAQLRLFGDKVQARKYAAGLGIPTIPGSVAASNRVDDLIDTAEAIGYPVMLKAVAGGGGRGMRTVNDRSELERVFDSCSREAEAAFGNGDLFLEKLVVNARHIEVQVFGDTDGNLVHLYERECSLQIRNQKVIEFAPAPNLDEDTREFIFLNALVLGSAEEYLNAGTFEFLLDVDTGAHYFIECNPRIQVEHTVTEQITGMDLVQLQFQLASGITLVELGIHTQTDVEKPRGFSVQSRVVTKGSGTLHSYREPSGPGIRVDANGYTGYEVPASFDPLIAKVVTSVTSNESF
ncbi:MAG: ATP-grasp domain-containing protein, partial [Gammaproteobacteria bacterium]|nr:ATP-grasp domain-containing protein [Gammaproteobacteria bacterium]